MPKIKTYHRPISVGDVLHLLARSDVNSVVVAGGTYINAHLPEGVEEVVDLQAVGLDQVSSAEGRLTLGAMVRLQTIVENEQAPALLREAAHRAGPNTFRNEATVGGTIVRADWESELMAALLIFEAEVEIQLAASANDGSVTRTIPLSDFQADISVALNGGLITAVSLATTGKTASERVARTPADSPIVSALARFTESGQVRLALCGVAHTPILVDPKPDQLTASLNPPSDFRGSCEYRRQMAITLSRRVIASVQT